MSQAKKIRQATKDFVKLYHCLKEHGKIPKHRELCNIMGINSIATLSEILSQRQNIQSEQFKKFINHFGTLKSIENTNSQNPEFKLSSEELTAFMAVLNNLLKALPVTVTSLDMIGETGKDILRELREAKY